MQATAGTYAGVAGQNRAAYYWAYADPQGLGATATVGAGTVQVAIGSQAYG